MARTKTVARKSTGGKAPPRDLRLISAKPLFDVIQIEIASTAQETSDSQEDLSFLNESAKLPQKDKQDPVGKDLGTIFNSPDFSNFVVEAGSGENKTRFHVIKEVLMARSEYFHAALSAPMIEKQTGILHEPDIPGPIMHDILYFLYTGFLPKESLTLHDLFVLLPAAKQLCMDRLLSFVDEVTCSSVRIRPENVIQVICFAESLGMKGLMDKALKRLSKFISRNSDNGITCEDPLPLPLSSIPALLSNSFIMPTCSQSRLFMFLANAIGPEQRSDPAIRKQFMTATASILANVSPIMVDSLFPPASPVPYSLAICAYEVEAPCFAADRVLFSGIHSTALKPQESEKKEEGKGTGGVDVSMDKKGVASCGLGSVTVSLFMTAGDDLKVQSDKGYPNTNMHVEIFIRNENGTQSFLYVRDWRRNNCMVEIPRSQIGEGEFWLDVDVGIETESSKKRKRDGKSDHERSDSEDSDESSEDFGEWF